MRCVRFKNQYGWRKNDMIYRSLHNISHPVSFKEALFKGMASDDGLYVPEHFPLVPVSQLHGNESITLQSIGLDVITRFIDEIPLFSLREIIEKAWNFPIPLRQLDERLFLLELFHGPTLAFKDVGARFMAGVMGYFLEHDHRELTIIVATSGDTGSAVANGFLNVPRITVYVLYPSNKISPLQEKQITTLGGNIHAIEVDGTFDDCQRLVKEAFSDEKLRSVRNITTANSINIARLIPQIAYYFWCNVQLGKYCDVEMQPPVITVPSGNFGNLTAALYSKEMGNPVRRFIAATNANDVVPRYFNTGFYHPEPSRQTLSNAMDVGAPSNLARIRELFDHDLTAMKKSIEAMSFGDEETLGEICAIYEQYKYIADPHTAVGLTAARRYLGKNPSSGPVVVAATAHPGKFPETVKRATGIEIPLPPQLAEAMTKTKKTTPIGKNYKELREFLAS
jgi:threonine synthase